MVSLTCCVLSLWAVWAPWFYMTSFVPVHPLCELCLLFFCPSVYVSEWGLNTLERWENNKYFSVYRIHDVLFPSFVILCCDTWEIFPFMLCLTCGDTFSLFTCRHPPSHLLQTPQLQVMESVHLSFTCLFDYFGHFSYAEHLSFTYCNLTWILCCNKVIYYSFIKSCNDWLNIMKSSQVTRHIHKE
jgi:hypothetical protein